MRDRGRGFIGALAGLAALALAVPAAAGPEAAAGASPVVPAPTVPAPAASAPAQPFDACLSDLAAAAEEAGVPRALADAQLTGLAPDPDAVAATRNQAEFARPIWAYIEASVTDAKVADGRAKLEQWAPTLQAIEARYGVDRHVLVAFWGVESSYGAVLDDPGIVRPVVRALASLACGDHGRAAYWRTELIAALKILAAGDAPPERLTGSWAGAMGHTQFMPTVYLARAVDFDGDGRRDIWTSVPDALASTAAYLVAEGWRPGVRWGYEARLPEGFDLALADETTPRSLDAWRALGVRPVRDDPAADGSLPATLILPAGARGPAFLLTQNFPAILRYNTALSYALTVGLLSDRLRGEPGLARDWPRGDRMLSADERRDLQTRLDAGSYPVGTVDGKIGPRTRAALRAYQKAKGLPPDGYADATVLERMRAGP
ncbi:lytic murein transglycosylase [Methylobacterium sp. NEAU 140]|uniref:lytic murein transglycosylase n=1 Tax=Methylobacterium sp. NEAU 140 TaxID=3064945 RepID=UPI0027338886|nr:lytic murein transglycosylase [Methylobacterium sp. NEAU 140]MDP4022653.1 lytic murein transglycosylase [Methylobacterium sp. NEAU 140]